MAIGPFDLAQFAAALAVGGVVGAVYCVALRRALRQLAGAQPRWRSYVAGSAVRTVLAAAVLAATGIGEPARAALAVIGFVIGRSVMLRVSRDVGDHRA